MNRGRAPRVTVVLMVCSLLLEACSFLAPRPDPSRFFVLTPMPGLETSETTPQAGATALSVGVGPIDFPDYLERTQIVRRAGPNRIEFSESDRWAEPLEQNFTRVLAQDLSLLLGTDGIVTYPWYSSTRLDYQVEIEVLHLEVLPDGAAHLGARWTLRDGKSKKALRTGEMNLTETAESPETEASVGAMSRAVGKLGRQIAAAITGA